MNEIKWGETHCPVCEKPFAKDADYDEGYRLERTYGADSQPLQEFEARLCWADCYEFDTLLKRLGEVLAERDTLRAENERLQAKVCELESTLYPAPNDLAANYINKWLDGDA